jgi:hypothetical protein
MTPKRHRPFTEAQIREDLGFVIFIVAIGVFFLCD